MGLVQLRRGEVSAQCGGENVGTRTAMEEEARKPGGMGTGGGDAATGGGASTAARVLHSGGGIRMKEECGRD